MSEWPERASNAHPYDSYFFSPERTPAIAGTLPGTETALQMNIVVLTENRFKSFPETGLARTAPITAEKSVSERVLTEAIFMVY